MMSLRDDDDDDDRFFFCVCSCVCSCVVFAGMRGALFSSSLVRAKERCEREREREREDGKRETLLLARRLY